MSGWSNQTLSNNPILDLISLLRMFDCRLFQFSDSHNQNFTIYYNMFLIHSRKKKQASSLNQPKRNTVDLCWQFDLVKTLAQVYCVWFWLITENLYSSNFSWECPCRITSKYTKWALQGIWNVTMFLSLACNHSAIAMHANNVTFHYTWTNIIPFPCYCFLTRHGCFFPVNLGKGIHVWPVLSKVLMMLLLWSERSGVFLQVISASTVAVSIVP